MVCLTPGCPNPVTGRRKRCHLHQPGAGDRPQYGPAHQQASRALIAQHRALYGDNCPGIPGVVAAHPDADLVADHVVPGDPASGYQVIGRSCNTRRMHGS